MRAAILAGGLGTRLAPYTTVLPKPLVPVGDRPILELILRQLGSCGFERVDLCVNHMSHLIAAYLDQSPDVPADLDIHHHLEEEPLGTAGAIRDLEAPDGPLLVMNGDILTTLDYGELVRFHTEQDAAMTIATHTKDVQLALGVIEGEDAEVTGFVEKPTLHYEVSMGIYVYSPEAIEMIPAGRFDFPDLVLALLEAGKAVRKYRFDGRWFDVGTPAEHEAAQAAYYEDPAVYEREPC